MSTYYLMHHGVEGQQWGKRNGPPYPLDSEGKADLRAQKKEAKAAAYKEREIQKIDKRNNKELSKSYKKVTKAELKLETAYANYADSKKIEKLTAKLNAANFESYYKSGINAFEKNAIKKMSVKDVSDEKKLVGRAYVASTLASVGTSAVMHLAGVPLTVFVTPDARKLKTNTRLTINDFALITTESTKQARIDTEKAKKAIVNKYNELKISDNSQKSNNPDKPLSDSDAAFWKELARMYESGELT